MHTEGFILQTTLRNALKRFQNARKGLCCEQQSKTIQDSLYTTLGAPLKAVQQKYLREVVKTCYPEKHMAEDFTNSEQIRMCREKTHAKYFGAFETMVENERNSAQFRY